MAERSTIMCKVNFTTSKEIEAAKKVIFSKIDSQLGKAYIVIGKRNDQPIEKVVFSSDDIKEFFPVDIYDIRVENGEVRFESVHNGYGYFEIKELTDMGLVHVSNEENIFDPQYSRSANFFKRIKEAFATKWYSTRTDF